MSLRPWCCVISVSVKIFQSLIVLNGVTVTGGRGGVGQLRADIHLCAVLLNLLTLLTQLVLT